jgi:hypothetical protein
VAGIFVCRNRLACMAESSFNSRHSMDDRLN